MSSSSWKRILARMIHDRDTSRRRRASLDTSISIPGRLEERRYRTARIIRVRNSRASRFARRRRTGSRIMLLTQLPSSESSTRGIITTLYNSFIRDSASLLDKPSIFYQRCYRCAKSRELVVRVESRSIVARCDILPQAAGPTRVIAIYRLLRCRLLKNIDVPGAAGEAAPITAKRIHRRLATRSRRDYAG